MTRQTSLDCKKSSGWFPSCHLILVLRNILHLGSFTVNLESFLAFCNLREKIALDPPYNCQCLYEIMRCYFKLSTVQFTGDFNSLHCIVSSTFSRSVCFCLANACNFFTEISFCIQNINFSRHKNPTLIRKKSRK